LFQSGLADTRKWAEQHFTKNIDLGNFISELDQFSLIKIRSHFPDISGSLKILRDITKLRIEADKAMPLAVTPAADEKAEPPKPSEIVAPNEAVTATQK